MREGHYTCALHAREEFETETYKRPSARRPLAVPAARSVYAGKLRARSRTYVRDLSPCVYHNIAMQPVFALGYALRPASARRPGYAGKGRGTSRLSSGGDKSRVKFLLARTKLLSDGCSVAVFSVTG